MNSYLVTGTCQKVNYTGDFSLSVDAETKDEAASTAKNDLSRAGYKNIKIESVNIQRCISKG